MKRAKRGGLHLKRPATSLAVSSKLPTIFVSPKPRSSIRIFISGNDRRVGLDGSLQRRLRSGCFTAVLGDERQPVERRTVIGRCGDRSLCRRTSWLRRIDPSGIAPSLDCRESRARSAPKRAPPYNRPAPMRASRRTPPWLNISCSMWRGSRPRSIGEGRR